MLAIFIVTATVLAFVGIATVAVKTLLVDGPAFERISDQFDLRINYGDHIRLISSKPAPIVWEEPEAYFPVRNEIRVPVSLGYKVETLV